MIALRFFTGELKHEIRWKAIRIAFHCFIQVSSVYAVERGQIKIEHHLLAAKMANRLTRSAQTGMISLLIRGESQPSSRAI